MTSLWTRANDILGLDYPIVQAGMSTWNTNAALVGAVSAAGGLGVLGCFGRAEDDLVRQVAGIRARTDKPFGVNFVVHLLDEAAFAAALTARVPIFSFFRGSGAVVATVVARAHEAGAVVLYQVTTVEEALQAADAGADVLAVQGNQAGGHMGPHALEKLFPAVREALSTAMTSPPPLFVAGGVADGAGLVRWLRAGADGAVMGTRFLATTEAPISAGWKRALIMATGPDATMASPIFDLIWDTAWPGVQARALHNSLTRRWQGREDALRDAVESVRADIQRAERADDADGMVLLAGAAVNAVDDVLPAAEVLHRLVEEAQAALSVPL